MAKSDKNPRIVTIAKASEEHPRHSEGAVIERTDASLLLVWQEYVRSSKGSGDEAPNNLAAMTSRDGGLTWSDHRILIRPEAGDVNVYSPSFLRLADGELLFFYFHYSVLEAGKPPVTSAFVRRSRDDGQTFSEPAALWSRQPYGFASSVARLLSTGRIVMPVGRQTGAVWSATDHEVGGCLYSDDRGRTWQTSGNWVDLPMRGAMEQHIAELRDGRLMMVMRTQLGAVFRAYSADAGASWSKPQTTGLRAPESCPELIGIPTTGDLLIVWNNSPYDPGFRSHFGKRSPLTVAVSRDDGETWTHVKDVETDPAWAFSNPGVSFTRSGRCILNYWALPYTADWTMNSPIDLKAALLDIDWLYA